MNKYSLPFAYDSVTLNYVGVFSLLKKSPFSPQLGQVCLLFTGTYFLPTRCRSRLCQGPAQLKRTLGMENEAQSDKDLSADVTVQCIVRVLLFLFVRR